MAEQLFSHTVYELAHIAGKIIILNSNLLRDVKVFIIDGRKDANKIELHQLGISGIRCEERNFIPTFTLN